MTARKIYKALQRRFMKYVVYPPVAIVQDSAWRVKTIHVERIGSAYGGGWIALGLLSEKSIAYSVGIGCDITFDELLIERTRCTVFGFDPTPKSADWIRRYSHVPANFIFVPVGLADSSGRRKLFLPSNQEFVSGSIAKDLHGGFVECEFLSLDDIMQRQGHSFVDLLKIDIEGAEFSLFERWLADVRCLPVAQIWVEFHPELVGKTTTETAKFVRRLDRIGLIPGKRAYLQNPNHYLLLNRTHVKELQSCTGLENKH